MPLYIKRNIISSISAIQQVTDASVYENEDMERGADKELSSRNLFSTTNGRSPNIFSKMVLANTVSLLPKSAYIEKVFQRHYVA